MRRVRQGALLPLQRRDGWPVQWRVVLAVVAAVAAFLAGAAGAEGASHRVVPVALVLCFLALWPFFSVRRRLMVLLAANGEARAGLVVVPATPAAEVDTTGNRGQQLQLGRDEIIFVGPATRWALPGPARGGVTRVVLAAGAVVFCQGQRPVAQVDALLFDGNHEQLLSSVESLGIDVDRVSTAPTGWVTVALHHISGMKPVIIDDHDSGGGNVMSTLPLLAVLLLSFGVVISLFEAPLLGAAYLAAWCVLAWMGWQAVVPLWRWCRRQGRMTIASKAS